MKLGRSAGAGQRSRECRQMTEGAECEVGQGRNFWNKCVPGAGHLLMCGWLRGKESALLV